LLASPAMTRLDASRANDQHRRKAIMMPLLRFRLRTIMIAIAALAVLMGLIRLLPLLFGISVTSIRFAGRDLRIEIDLKPGSRWDPDVPGGNHIVLYNNVHISIPLPSIAALVAIIIASFALVSYYRSRRRRKCQVKPITSAPDQTRPLP
jgi:hypothetical protein